MKRALLFAFATALLPQLAQAQVKFVTVTGAGTGSGSSWGNAISAANFRSVLQTAAYGTRFWMASGIYKPSLTNRDSAFTIPSGVKVYGGFAGTESALEARDTTNLLRKTILTGEIQGDTTVQNNSYNVVRFYAADGNTELNSLTVTKGCANGSGLFRTAGAGILSENSSPLFNHVVIQDNLVTGGGGGGMSAVNGNIRFSDCTFINNKSVGGAGFSFYHDRLSGPAGSGAYDTGGNIFLISSVFRSNSAVFVGGTAEFGTQATGNFYNCFFDANTSGDYGGGIFTQGDSLIVKNCRFRNNKSTGTTAWGGAAHINSYAAFDNVLFEGNEANTGGALAMFTLGLTMLSINNCTFVGNRSRANGDHIFRQNSDVGITNSIFDTVANGKGQFGQTAGNGTMTVTNSLSTKALPAWIINGGANIIGLNPQFTAPASGQYALSPCSPAVNRGNNSLMVAPAAAVDLAGKPRRYLSDTVDMGAYEYQGKKGAPVAAYTSIVNQATKVVAFTYTGTLPADSVRWIFGDGSTSSQLNPTHTYAARTNFNVCVTTYMSCGSNQKCQQVALAVGNSPALAHVSVYPNPANDFIIIDGMTAGSNVAVLSMVGQQLISNIIVSDRQSISFAALPSGMYLLRLVGDQNEERIIRIVKL